MTAAQQTVATQHEEPGDDRWRVALRRIVSGSWAVSLGAIVLAVVVGSVMIAVFDPGVRAASGYFFSRPADTFAAIGHAVGGAYSALFRGAVWDYSVLHKQGFGAAIRPLTNSLTQATPLVTAGLGVAIGFRSGQFNIGGRGQMLAAAIAGGWIGFGLNLPPVVHLVVAVVIGMAGGAVVAGIAGVLKATTGAHEVIVTIMLNYVVFYVLGYLLATPGLMQAPGSSNPKTPPMKANAIMPHLFGPRFTLHWGFVIALAAVAFAWWLLERSKLGFQFRAVGENPAAARVAGIDVGKTTVYSMLVGGALVGLAGVTQVLGTTTTGFGDGIDAGVGFDAITVALLGRSSPVGVLGAAILFGAFKAGGATMQAQQNVPIEIVEVVQACIVLFIAAPPLVRAVFRLPQPGTTPRRRPGKRAASQVAEVSA